MRNALQVVAGLFALMFMTGAPATAQTESGLGESEPLQVHLAVNETTGSIRAEASEKAYVAVFLVTSNGIRLIEPYSKSHKQLEKRRTLFLNPNEVSRFSSHMSRWAASSLRSRSYSRATTVSLEQRYIFAVASMRPLELEEFRHYSYDFHRTWFGSAHQAMDRALEELLPRGISESEWAVDYYMLWPSHRIHSQYAYSRPYCHSGELRAYYSTPYGTEWVCVPKKPRTQSPPPQDTTPRDSFRIKPFDGVRPIGPGMIPRRDVPDSADNATFRRLGPDTWPIRPVDPADRPEPLEMEKRRVEPVTPIKRVAPRNALPPRRANPQANRPTRAIERARPVSERPRPKIERRPRPKVEKPLPKVKRRPSPPARPSSPPRPKAPPKKKPIPGGGN